VGKMSRKKAPRYPLLYGGAMLPVLYALATRAAVQGIDRQSCYVPEASVRTVRFVLQAAMATLDSAQVTEPRRLPHSDRHMSKCGLHKRCPDLPTLFQWIGI